MKRFTRNLALVMALVLAIGCMPLTKAKAAEAKLAVTEKTIYVQQDDETKFAAKGYSGESYDTADRVSIFIRSYKLKRAFTDLPKGAVITAKSSDSSVAFFSKNYGRIFARKAGKADFTVYVDGEEVGTLALTVKANAKTVEVTNLPKDNVVGLDGIALEVAQKDANGNPSTDKIGYKILEGEDIAAVDKNGVVTVKKPGSFKLQVYTYQSDINFPGAIAKAEYELKASTNLLSVKQISDKAVELTFDSDMKDKVKTEDFTVYYKIEDTKKILEKESVEATKEDPTKVVLKIWYTITPDTTYYIEYDGQTVEFTGSGTTPKDVDSIVIETTEVVEGVLSDIEYKLYNKDGIEISLDKDATLTFITNDTDNASVVDDQIMIFEKGKSATVDAAYSYFYSTSEGEWLECKAEAKALIVAVKAAETTFVKSDWTIVNISELDIYDRFDFTKPYTRRDYVAVGDEYLYYFDEDFSDIEHNTRIAYRMETSDKTDNIISDDSVDENYEKILTFKSSDPSILMLNQYGDCDTFLVPIKEGTVNVLVYMQGNPDPVDFLPITIKPTRVPTTIEVKTDKMNINVASRESINGSTDSIFIDALVKDQYGDEMDTKVAWSVTGGSLATNPSYSTANGSIDSLDTYSRNGWDNYFESEMFGQREEVPGDEGNVVVKFEAFDPRTEAKTNVNTSLTFVTKIVPAPEDGKGITYKLTQSREEIDTKAEVSIMRYRIFGNYDNRFAVNAYYDGYRISDKNIENYIPENHNWSSLAPEQQGLYIEILHDGNDMRDYYDVEDGDPFFYAFGRTYTDPDTDTPDVSDKAPTGTYTVRLWDVSKVGDNMIGKPVDAVTFTVIDTQPELTWTQLKYNLDDCEGNIESAFKVMFKDEELDRYILDSDNFVWVEGSGYVYVKYVFMPIRVGYDKTYLLKSYINRPLEGEIHVYY